MATEATATVNVCDALAEEYLKKQAALVVAESELKAIRDLIEERVRQDGTYPPRATKTRVCYGDEFELRLTEATEVTVDMRMALAIREACGRAGVPRLFRKLFRRVEIFNLAGGAQKVLSGPLPAKAPRGLAGMFARALKITDKAPSVEVRPREKQAEAA